MMVGKTREALQFNCIGLLEELTDGEFHASAKSNVGWLYERQVRLIGANDEKAAAKIKGSTLAGVYIDELTEIPESFYQMCLSRLSRPGALMIATTNPDSPRNYVYTEIVQNDKIARKVWNFTIDDNTFLDAEYVKNIKREYSGVFYNRYILGEWVVAEGLVYPNYDNTVKTVTRQYTDYVVSMDYGTMNPTAMLLWGKSNKTWYAIKEYYHSGRDTNELKTDEQYYTELEKLCDGVKSASGGRIPLIVDPSAASFIALTISRHKFKVWKALNNVLDGIRHTASCIAEKRIMFNDCCQNTINEFGLYSWNPDAIEDTVIKDNDHAMDAVRYFVETKYIYNERR